MIYIIILLIILILLNYSDSLSLDVSPRTIRCVGQELDQEDAAIFSGYTLLLSLLLLIILILT
jgi:hypothetical protein